MIGQWLREGVSCAILILGPYFLFINAGAFVALGVIVGGVAISNLVQHTDVENSDTLIALASRVWFRSLQ